MLSPIRRIKGNLLAVVMIYSSVLVQFYLTNFPVGVFLEKNKLMLFIAAYISPMMFIAASLKGSSAAVYIYGVSVLL